MQLNLNLDKAKDRALTNNKTINLSLRTETTNSGEHKITTSINNTLNKILLTTTPAQEWIYPHNGIILLINHGDQFPVRIILIIWWIWDMVTLAVHLKREQCHLSTLLLIVTTSQVSSQPLVIKTKTVASVLLIVQTHKGLEVMLVGQTVCIKVLSI